MGKLLKSSLVACIVYCIAFLCYFCPMHGIYTIGNFASLIATIVFFMMLCICSNKKSLIFGMSLVAIVINVLFVIIESFSLMQHTLPSFFLKMQIYVCPMTMAFVFGVFAVVNNHKWMKTVSIILCVISALDCILDAIIVIVLLNNYNYDIGWIIPLVKYLHPVALLSYAAFYFTFFRMLKQSSN